MSDKTEVIYRTEYILKMNQFLRKADLDRIRAEFVDGLKSGIVFIDTRIVEVEAHQQPIAVILPDGTVMRLEEMP